MFNLIVKSIPWADGHDTFPRDRLLEDTEQALVERFNPAFTGNWEALKALPTLFVAESFNGNEIARVGSIITIQQPRRDLELEYFYDPLIPGIPNTLLESSAGQLGIPKKLNHTHWSVKTADLFRVILRHAPPRRPTPSGFKLLEPERIDLASVSLMMPFDPRFDQLHQTLKALCKSLGLHCRRADDIWEHAQILQDIVSLIDRSRVMIADCTDRNANVFYEIGIAHTLGREVILITQNDDDVPFDLRHLRFVRYLNNSEGLKDLVTVLRPRLETLTRSR